MPTSDADDGLPADDGDPDPVRVSGFDRTEAASVDLARWTDVATRTLVGESVTAGQLDLIFVDTDEMAELNETHMGHEGPTDVLSFPLDVEDDDFPALPADLGDDDDDNDNDDVMSLHLGDIVVCPAVAEKQAPEHCGSLDAELSLLIVHGVLHILGHDHVEPEETSAMQARERVHLAALGHTHPVAE